MKEITEVIKSGSIVGAVMDFETLAVAGSLPAGKVDFFEIRADSIACRAGKDFAVRDLKEGAMRLASPRILTVRHVSQGGMGALGKTERADLYAVLMPVAAAMDIEVRLASRFEKTLEDARAQGVKVILSEHNFEATPSLRSLRASAKKARSLGADVFKVAAQANTLGDIGVLSSFLGEAEELGIPLAVMGMGPFGKVSRLLLASGGSVLNYCSLSSTAAVPGQWSVDGFRERLAELKR